MADRYHGLMQLERIEAFVAVSDELNFRRAADRLCLSPSPVSRSITELENSVGGDLFIRRYHSVELTQLGRELLPLARAILADVDGFDARARILTGKDHSQTLKLGVSKLCPPEISDAVGKLLTSEMPSLKIDWRQSYGGDLLNRINTNDLDLALVQLPVDAHAYLSTLLLTMTPYVVMRKDNKLSQRESLALSELAGCTVAVGSTDAEPVAMRVMTDQLRQHGIVNIIQTPSFDLLELAIRVRHGACLALTLDPRSGGSAKIFDDDAFHLTPIDDQKFKFGLGIVQSRTSKSSASPAQEANAVIRRRWRRYTASLTYIDQKCYVQ